MKPLWNALLCALICAAPLAARPSPQDLDYKVIILVRDFEHPGLRSNRGRLAAEIIAAAIESSGLAEARRPKYRIREEYGLELDRLTVDDITQDDDGKWNAGTVEAGGGIRKIRSREEESAPPSDLEVTGTVGRLDKKWWIRAVLKERLSGKRVTQASAAAENADEFLDAARKVALQLQPAYSSRVLERRTEAILRAVNGGIFTPEAAARKLEVLHSAWPDAIEPCAARLALLQRAKSRDAKLIIKWAELTVQRMGPAGQDGRRYLMRLGVRPFQMLADAHEAEGRLQQAADAHRRALETHPDAHYEHWIEIIRLESKLGRDDELLDAYRAALKLRPNNAGLLLNFADLLVKLGKKGEALSHYRKYLTLKPDSPNAPRIRALLSKAP